MKYTLKEWRRLRGITQSDLAKRIGSSKLTIISWEKGRTEPKWSELIRLSKELNTGGIDNIVMPRHLT